MNMHPDTLLAYTAYGSGCRTARDCRMAAIDSYGLTMSYTDRGQSKTTRVDFDPPLRGADEVRRRLVALCVAARRLPRLTPAARRRPSWRRA